MRIVLLVSAFNGLTQATWSELRRDGHWVTVELATTDESMREAVRLARPDIIVCPYLKKRVPTDIWRNHRTVIVHPGPVGDRGPSSLDWAILNDERRWGVTAVQAVDDMDAGPVWSSVGFPMPRPGMSKSALYNGPVAEAALAVVRDVIAKARDSTFVPVPVDYSRRGVRGQPRPLMRQDIRRIEWFGDTADEVTRKIRASDGSPSALCTLAGDEVYAYDARPEGHSSRGDRPGRIVARWDGAVLVATADDRASIWIGHLRREGGPKLPATQVLARWLANVPGHPLAPDQPWGHTHREIRYERAGAIGWLTFDFYNGAMSTSQCRRLTAAFRHAASQDTRVVVLRGGETVFSNGIHLGVIEGSADPAAESWANIQAMDDLCHEIITCTHQLVVAAVCGNAGAGGVMLALGADVVAARRGVVLNPHYRTMNLYGSEYWTYLLPRRVGRERAHQLTTDCLPVGDVEALDMGLVDRLLTRDVSGYDEELRQLAENLAGFGWESAVTGKRRRREADERLTPLTVYRVRELARMASDFFDSDEYHRQRGAFIRKDPPQTTPLRLAVHRRSA